MIAVLDTAAALLALAPAWQTLWRREQDATPFQSPHWLLAWWAQFGTGMPRVAVSWRDGDLIGVLPLYVLPGERKALPIGAGTTDYLDGLGDCSGLLEAALGRLQHDPVDSCDLIDVPPSSKLPLAATGGWQAEWHDGVACPVLCLPDIPKRMRRKVSMSRHRADRAGRWHVETADAAGCPGFLADLARLHQSRWTAQGEAGVLADHRMRAFLAEASPSMLAAGLLRLTRLRLAGETIASMLVLLSPGRIYCYMAGFDPTHAYISPGTLLVAAAIDQAQAEGRQEVHFLRGRESYKYAWGGVDRLNRNGRLVPG